MLWLFIAKLKAVMMEGVADPGVAHPVGEEALIVLQPQAFVLEDVNPVEAFPRRLGDPWFDPTQHAPGTGGTIAHAPKAVAGDRWNPGAVPGHYFGPIANARWLRLPTCSHQNAESQSTCAL